MTEYAWFKLLVRAMGILLLALSIPGLIYNSWWIVTSLVSDGYGGTGEVIQSLLGSTGYSLCQAAIGMYLLLGAEGLIRYCLRGLSDRCLGCGYSLTNLPANACPECGLPLVRLAAPPPAQPSSANPVNGYSDSASTS